MQTKIDFLFAVISYLLAVKYFQNEVSYDLTVILIVILVCCIGAFGQIADLRRREGGIDKWTVFAIIATSLIIGVLAIELGKINSKIAPFMNIICIIGSFMSLSLLRGIKNAINRIVNMLPDFFKEYFKKKYGLQEQEKNEEL